MFSYKSNMATHFPLPLGAFCDFHILCFFFLIEPIKSREIAFRIPVRRFNFWQDVQDICRVKHLPLQNIKSLLKEKSLKDQPNIFGKLNNFSTQISPVAGFISHYS